MTAREGFEIQGNGFRLDRRFDGPGHRLRGYDFGYGREKAQHHYVGDDPPAQRFGHRSGRNTEMVAASAVLNETVVDQYTGAGADR